MFVNTRTDGLKVDIGERCKHNRYIYACGIPVGLCICEIVEYRSEGTFTEFKKYVKKLKCRHLEKGEGTLLFWKVLELRSTPFPSV